MKTLLKHGGLLAVAGLLLSPIAQAATGSFNITGPSSTTQNLNPSTGNQTGTVTSSGNLSIGSSNVAVTFSGASGTSATLTNSGTISQTGTGRALRNTTADVNLTITNNVGALIKAADADAFQINVNSAVSMNNYGIVQSLNASAGGAQAIDWNGITNKSNILHNFSTGQLLATAADAVRPGVNGIVTNDASGIIKATPIVDTTVITATQATSSDGVDAQFNSGVVITNSGLIEGRHGITGGETQDNFNITVTNNVGGTITGVNGSALNIDGAVPTTLQPNLIVSHADVVNNGTMVGNWDNAHYTVGDGDGIDIDGTLNLTNNGIIRGVGGSASNNPQGLAIGGGSIIINNAGAEITGNNPTASGTVGEGIRVDDSNNSNAYAAVNITNTGLVRGYQGAGINIISGFSNSITNNVGGTIRGAGANGAIIASGSGSETVINSGAIIGDNGQAIDLGAGNNTLNVQGGAASILGDVSGGTGGSNTLNLDIGAGNSFSYAGALSNFANVQVNGGTTTLTGASSYAGPTTVNSGALLASNSTGSATGSSAVEVMSGASFGGTGSITGPLTVDAGGTLSPGVGGIGMLAVGDTLLKSGSIFAVDLNPFNGTADRVNVTGTVGLNFSNLVINLLYAPTFGQTFDILSNDGTDLISGFFNQGSSVSAILGGQTWNFAINYAYNADGGAVGNDIRLTAVPVPGAALLFGTALTALIGLRRRKA